MAIDQKALELEMRFAAIEHLLAELYRMVYQAAGATSGMIDAEHKRFRELLMRETFPTDDPATSDLVAAEWEAAASALLDRISLAVKGAQP